MSRSLEQVSAELDILKADLKMFKEESQDAIAEIFEVLNVLMAGNKKALEITDARLVELNERLLKLEAPDVIRDPNAPGKEI